MPLLLLWCRQLLPVERCHALLEAQLQALEHDSSCSVGYACGGGSWGGCDSSSGGSSQGGSSGLGRGAMGSGRSGGESGAAAGVGASARTGSGDLRNHTALAAAGGSEAGREAGGAGGSVSTVLRCLALMRNALLPPCWPCPAVVASLCCRLRDLLLLQPPQRLAAALAGCPHRPLTLQCLCELAAAHASTAFFASGTGHRPRAAHFSHTPQPKTLVTPAGKMYHDPGQWGGAGASTPAHASSIGSWVGSAPDGVLGISGGLGELPMVGVLPLLCHLGLRAQPRGGVAAWDARPPGSTSGTAAHPAVQAPDQSLTRGGEGEKEREALLAMKALTALARDAR